MFRNFFGTITEKIECLSEKRQTSPEKIILHHRKDSYQSGKTEKTYRKDRKQHRKDKFIHRIDKAILRIDK